MDNTAITQVEFRVVSQRGRLSFPERGHLALKILSLVLYYECSSSHTVPSLGGNNNSKTQIAYKKSLLLLFFFAAAYS